MPSQIIHLLAARAAFQRSEYQPIPTDRLVTSAFNLGCQGPDIFSHNRRTRPFALAYARLLHRHDYGRFCAAAASVASLSGDPLFLSWLCGFVTHQAVDRTLHPYIVNRSFVPGESGVPGVSPALFHAFLERVLDVKLLEHAGFGPISSFGIIDSFRLDDAAIASLASRIAPVLLEIYPSRDEVDTEAELRVKNAFIDTIFFYGLTDPVHTAFARVSGSCDMRDYMELGSSGVALLYPETADSGVDWLNLAKSSWLHPVTGESSTESVPELFERAVTAAARAVSLLARFLAGNIGSADLEDGISNDCLSVRGPDGTIGSVRYYEPFDIARVLLDETEKRRRWFEEMVC
jgi:hypothetical protein